MNNTIEKLRAKELAQRVRLNKFARIGIVVGLVALIAGFIDLERKDKNAIQEICTSLFITTMVWGVYSESKKRVSELTASKG